MGDSWRPCSPNPYTSHRTVRQPQQQHPRRLWIWPSRAVIPVGGLPPQEDAGFLNLALHFAQTGSTDPRTLSRASRDLVDDDAKISLQVGRMAVRRMLDGDGYDVTGIDVIDAYHHLVNAAEKLGLLNAARDDVFSLARNAQQRGSPLADILLRRCAPDLPM